MKLWVCRNLQWVRGTKFDEFSVYYTLLRNPCLSPNLRNTCCFSVAVISDSLGPMDCRTPCFPVLHYLLEFAQTHVHWVGDAIQPSHPLSSPSPPAFNLSQYLGLFQWVSSLHRLAKVLELQLLGHLKSVDWLLPQISCINEFLSEGQLLFTVWSISKPSFVSLQCFWCVF